MSRIGQFALLSEYNRLMNQRQMEATSLLSPEILKRDAGAYFDSILGTLNHIMVGDIVWLKRFANHPKGYNSLQYLRECERPATLDQILHTDLDSLEGERKKLDGIIIDWCKELKEPDLDTALTYKNMMGKTFTKNLGDLILHLFLHQTHHRGQVTTLLCQHGIDFGDTDLLEIIPNLPG